MNVLIAWLSIYSTCFLGYYAAKILAVTFVPTPSHQTFFNSIWKELSLRGHEVTAVSSLPLRDHTLTNLTEIDTSFIPSLMPEINVVEQFSKNSFWISHVLMKNLMEYLMNLTLSCDEVKELINSDAEFDVIISEVHHFLGFAFGEIFKAPVIGISSCAPALDVYDIYGNPTHPLISIDSNMPVESSPLDHPYAVRFNSLLHNIYSRMLHYWHYLPRANELAKKHFGKDFPNLEEIIRRYASILLTNVNIVVNPIRANVPTVIEINRIHIRENRSLPKDLQDFLDSATNGAIYFSLGASVPCSSLDNRTLNEIVGTFAQLPYNVLWKWEKDAIPDVTSNVLVRKFFPQQDLLAHPNIKVFVTQGGMQSIEESIFKEVPMVGIPILYDQPLNVRGIVELGIALRVNPSDLTKDSLTKAILEVAENSSYKKRVKELKSLMEDQPIKGLDKAIWWIEYVIRHKGAKHLQSSAAKMSFIRYFMLDVIFVLLSLFLIIFFVIYIIVTSTWRIILKVKDKLE